MGFDGQNASPNSLYGIQIQDRMSGLLLEKSNQAWNGSFNSPEGLRLTLRPVRSRSIYGRKHWFPPIVSLICPDLSYRSRFIVSKSSESCPTYRAVPFRARLVACSHFLHHWRSGKKSPARPRRAMCHKNHVVWWFAQRFFGPVKI
jgi:hypothetical protein